MTAPEKKAEVDAYWAAYFGCTPEDLSAPKTLVVTHAALQGYDGALVFRHGPACIVSVPDSVPEIERSKLRAAKPEEVFTPKFLARVFVIRKEKVTGPAWVGISDGEDFQPVPGGARMLGDHDEEALQRLAEGCGEFVWKESKLLLDLKPMFGKFEGSELVAVSGYRTMGVLAYTGVVTHPERRGKGHAKAVAGAAMEHAIGQGLVALWRTPEANKAAVALATSLGFKPYATTLDIQLVETEF